MAIEASDAVYACVPLAVDLHGTLIKHDLLVEAAFAHVGHRPVHVGALGAAFFRGKAAFKTHIAAATDIDVTHLPYDDGVVALSKGRPRHCRGPGGSFGVQRSHGFLDISSGTVEQLYSPPKRCG